MALCGVADGQVKDMIRPRDIWHLARGFHLRRRRDKHSHARPSRRHDAASYARLDPPCEDSGQSCQVYIYVVRCAVSDHKIGLP
eukprot:scaffold1435_cov267-Pinguiococcus_pyrenoidosus.AAC.14